MTQPTGSFPLPPEEVGSGGPLSEKAESPLGGTSDDSQASSRTYRQVPVAAPPEEFRAWFNQMFQSITGRPAQGSPDEWAQRYQKLRSAFEAARSNEEA